MNKKFKQQKSKKNTKNVKKTKKTSKLEVLIQWGMLVKLVIEIINMFFELV